MVTAQDLLRDKFRWKKVEVPKAWIPKEPEELVGFYAGRTLKNGRYGPYDVVLVAVPDVGMRMVTGTQLIQLVDASLVAYGQPIRIVFNGYIQLGDKKKMKSFDLFIRDGEPLTVEDMPEVST